MSYEVLAPGPTDDTGDPRTLYQAYKEECAPLFTDANNVAEMKELYAKKLFEVTDKETLEKILHDLQTCRTTRLLFYQSSRIPIDANHQHLLDVLLDLWRYGNAVKKSMSCPLSCLFVEKAVSTFGVEHATVIRQVAVLVHAHHDDLCAQYGVDPNTRDDEELRFVAESLVIGFLSLRGSDGDERPVTRAKFSALAKEFEREHGRVRD